VAQIQGIQQAWDRGDFQKAKSLLRAQIPKPGEEDLRGFEWRYLWKLCRDASAITFSNAFSRQVISVAISPDGSLLASGDRSGQIELRRTHDWSLVEHSMRHSEGTRSLQFTSDGKYLVTAGDISVRIWDLANGQEKTTVIFTNRGPGFISCARLSPDGALIAAGTYSGKWVHVWEVSRAELVASFEGRFGGMRFVDFSPDGSKLAFSNGDSMIYLWDVHTRGVPRKIPTRHPTVAIVKFSPDGRLLASSGSDDVIRLWSTQDWAETGRLHGHSNIPRAMTFSSDGRVLASGCSSGKIKLWNLSNQTELLTLSGHSILVEDLAIFPDAKRVASASSDATLKIWNLPDTVERPRFSNAFASPRWARFSTGGHFFVTFGAEVPTERKIWNTESGQLIATLPRLHSESHLGEFSPDSRIFAAPGQSNGVFIWSVPEGNLVAQLSTGTNLVDTIAFSKDGRLFAGGRDDPTIRCWSARSFNVRDHLTGFGPGVGEIKFSPDGEILAAWCPDGDIRLRAVSSLASFPSILHASDFPAMTFSPDSKLLALALERGTDLWEVRTGKRLVYLEGSTTAFSPDGRFLAVCPQGEFEGSVEQQNTVVLWDLKKRREAVRLPWTSGWVFSLTYSPDGRTLISSDNWRTVRFFNTQIGREVFTLPRNGGGSAIFSPDGNGLLILDVFGQSEFLRASSFNEVEKELAAESKRKGWKL
jgi:WD40 repeat protein